MMAILFKITYSPFEKKRVICKELTLFLLTTKPSLYRINPSTDIVSIIK